MLGTKTVCDCCKVEITDTVYTLGLPKKSAEESLKLGRKPTVTMCQDCSDAVVDAAFHTVLAVNGVSQEPTPDQIRQAIKSRVVAGSPIDGFEVRENTIGPTPQEWMASHAATLTNEQYVRLKLVDGFLDEGTLASDSHLEVFCERINTLTASILGTAPPDSQQIFTEYAKRWQAATGMTLEQAEELKRVNDGLEKTSREIAEKRGSCPFRVGDWVKLKSTGKQMKITAIHDGLLLCDVGDGAVFTVASNEYDLIELAPGL
jgi:uncharacterized protein YodC (DUF2158 family)